MFRFGMFNSINGDRRYKAEDFAQYFATFIGNGIFVKPSDCLQICANGDSMSVIVRPGKAWVNGYYLINDEDYNLPLVVGDTTLNRIDRIVIRLDFIQRKMSVEVKKGALSSSPVAPTLKRDADAYELALADVYIAKGALTITQGAITDTRLNNNLCGLMHNPIYQVDTTTIFNQYQGWFEDYSVTKAAEFLQWQNKVTSELEAWIDAQEKDFEAWRQAEEALYYTWLQGRKDNFDKWFETVKDILDTTADGKLFNKIQEHEDASMPHKFLDEVDAKTYMYGFKVNSDRDGNVFMMKDASNPNAPTIAIEGPTKKLQEEIRDKVEHASYLEDIEGNIYKPRMDEQLMVGASFLKQRNETAGVIDKGIMYTFDSYAIYKYDIETGRLVESVTIPSGNGGVVMNKMDRSVAQDDTFIYFIQSASDLSTISKFNKLTNEISKMSSFSAGSYGYINKLVIADDKILFANIDGGVSGIYIFDKALMNPVNSKRLVVGGYLCDFLVKDGHVLSLTREGMAGRFHKFKLDATLITTYLTPTNIFSENNSSAPGRLFESDLTGEIFLTLRSRGTLSKIDWITCVDTQLVTGLGGNIEMFLMPDINTYEITGTGQNAMLYRFDAATNQMTGFVPVETDYSLQQVIYVNINGIHRLHSGGSHKGKGVFTELKYGFVISHYEKG